MPNIRYFGDNLNVLHEHIASESVDLIYLDPPFNSNRACKFCGGAKVFCRGTSHFSTARKNWERVGEILVHAFIGSAYSPCFILSTAPE